MDTKKPVVSIIMPVYNAEPYIEDSISSVLNQTYKDIELICVNDCTQDLSFDICKKYRSKNDKIVLIENEQNMGQEYTRNIGLKYATGKYIMFLDSDDMLDPYAIEKIVDAAEESNCDVVLSSLSMINKGQEIPQIIGISDGYYEMPELAKYLLSKISLNIISCIGTKMYRRRFIEINHIEFEKKYKFNEDGAFAFKALLVAKNVYTLNYPFYKYVIRQNSSVMSSYRPNMFETIFEARKLIREIYIKNECYSEMSIYYNKQIADLAINTMHNEAKHGNRKSFANQMRYIVSNKDAINSIINYRKSKIFDKKTIILKMLEWRMFNMLFLMCKTINE